MAWESIARVSRKNHTASDSLPADGVRVSMRSTRSRSSKTVHNYVVIRVGAALAGKLMFAKEQPVRLMMGTGDDAGQLAVVIDPAAKFLARQQPKAPEWWITIPPVEAAERFSFPLETFTVSTIRPTLPENGVDRRFIVPLPKAALKLAKAA